VRNVRVVVTGGRDGPERRSAVRDRVPARDRSPDRYSRFDAPIREAARVYQLPEAFIRAVMRVESDFDPNVVSRVGAMGLMQLMPGTAANMGVRDPFDPRENILGGVRYLRVLANGFNGDLVLTIAAYNAGEGAVVRHRGVPPYEETQRYVQRVLGWYYHYVQVEQGRAAPAPAGRAWAPAPTQ
jgi:soluble lytic murein transglycosylase-like protein